ncbi:unnamed protein product [Didymodactylos carnosus]|uniref:Uncharacterized protein n=1 Tax=Didymodactylos carnosus TaxID=1234261 RepID=A0A8S2SJ36_9BILA|nr:unnamed protein product [Didymodactylos carnosus]CAF4204508.1 unnamed protein product [Didymodactylos carnosus]
MSAWMPIVCHGYVSETMRSNIRGCSQALYRYYHQHLVTLGCVAIGVTFLQVFTIIPLFWLIKRLQKQLAHSIAPITTNKQHHLSQELSYIPIQQGET